MIAPNPGAHKLKAVRVSLDNRPGALAQAARALAKNGVNLEAVEVEVLGQYAFFRFFTEHSDTAEQVLKKEGYITTSGEILEVLLSDKPGELARVCEILAQGKVNIESCFGSQWGHKLGGRFFLRVSDIDRAHRLLQEAAIVANKRAR